MFLIDSHCHLDKLNYSTLHQNVDDVLNKAKSANVRLTLAICTTLSGFYKMISMIGIRKDVLFSCGIHPIYISENLYEFSKIRSLVSSKQVVAIGETGLDYYYQDDNKCQQKDLFRKHIVLGREQNKPVIVHTRNASKDTLSILREENANECRGIIHCFTEDCNTAKFFLDLGFYISFSGIITFKNREKLQKVANYVPFDRILIETDSPYLSPVPYRGKENQPAYLSTIAKFIAQLKGVTIEKFADITTTNFCELFNIEISNI